MAAWDMIADIRDERGDGCDILERFAVPGGWLYRTVYIHPVNLSRAGVAMVFVPDPFQQRSG